MKYLLIGFFILASFNARVLSHGYLAEPPARSTAWLFDKDFEKCCTNYNHMQMSCGGTNTLWAINGGNCGICGEAWNETKYFEKGGEKYLGKIVRTYSQGDAINVSIVITANHRGYFEFRICNVDGWVNDATQECLNKTILNVSNNYHQQQQQQHNQTRFYLNKTSTSAVFNLTLQLPKNFTCTRCVLQWKYVAGNLWGFDDTTNKSCVGCGVIQEQFYGCADISIFPFFNDNNKTIECSNISTESITLSLNSTTKMEISKNETIVCKSRLKFGTFYDLPELIDLFCERICKESCNSLNETELATDDEEDDDVCLNTCPILCICM